MAKQISILVLTAILGLANCGGPISYGVRYKQPIFAYAAEEHPVVDQPHDQALLKPIPGAYDNSNIENHGPPTPYQFGYQIKDDEGATQHRQESGDENGVVKGSYGYTDPFGVYRQVHYVADAGGFRAVIKTNEPGTSNDSPADVKIEAEDPPAIVHEKAAHASASKINIPVGVRPGYSEPYPHYVAPRPVSYVAPAHAVNYGYVVPHATVPVAKIVPVSRRHSYRERKPVVRYVKHAHY